MKIAELVDRAGLCASYRAHKMRAKRGIWRHGAHCCPITMVMLEKGYHLTIDGVNELHQVIISLGVGVTDLVAFMAGYDGVAFSSCYMEADSYSLGQKALLWLREEGLLD